MSNSDWRALIQVAIVESYRFKLPVTISSNFPAGEIVTGTTSGATAEVVTTTILADTKLVIKNKSGFFLASETITSASGSAVTTGVGFSEKEPYVNNDPDIDIGTSIPGYWILDTTKSHIAKIEDAYSEINKDEGGAVAGGYSFGFEVTNFGLSEAINNDGLFFENLVVRYYLDIGDGDGYVQEWVGVIDTAPEITETTMAFKCIEDAKGNSTKIGSKEIPICLNKNLKCKLPLASEDETIYYSRKINNGEIKDNIITSIDPAKNSFESYVYPTGEWGLLVANNFKDVFFEVSMGGGTGKTFKVLNYKFKSSNSIYDRYEFFLDDDVSSLVSAARVLGTGVPVANPSLIRAVSRVNAYNLSQKEVAVVHEAKNSEYYSPLTLTNSDDDSVVLSNPEDYIENIRSDGVHQIFVKGIDDSDEVGTFAKYPFRENAPRMTRSEEDLHGIWYFDFEYEFLKHDRLLLERFIKLKNSDLIFDFGLFRVSDFFYTGTVVDGFDTNLTSVEVRAYYNNVLPDGYATLVSFTNETFPIGFRDGNDLIINFSEACAYNKDLFKVDNFYKSDSIITLRLFVKLNISLEGEAFPAAEYTLTDKGVRVLTRFKVKNPSVGCSGENVDLGAVGEWDTVPNTLNYLQTEYNNIDPGKIYTPSYNQTELDFGLYPNPSRRNAAHQIIDQVDYQQLEADLIFNYILGLFKNKNGLWFLENWLPKSIVFSDTPTVITFNDTMWESIGNLRRGSILDIITDFELNFDYNESTGKYDNRIRIKGTDLLTFDRLTCTEGVAESETVLASQCWELGSAGRKRAGRQVQFVFDSKWFKSGTNRGKGNAEALTFIRNFLGYRNKPIDKVDFVVPVKNIYRDLNLLSFVTIQDEVVTNGYPRKAWIESIRLSWERQRYEYDVSFDLHPNDPLLIRIGKIIKGNYPDIIVNGNFPDKIINGPGNL